MIEENGTIDHDELIPFVNWTKGKDKREEEKCQTDCEKSISFDHLESYRVVLADDCSVLLQKSQSEG